MEPKGCPASIMPPWMRSWPFLRWLSNKLESRAGLRPILASETFSYTISTGTRLLAIAHGFFATAEIGMKEHDRLTLRRQ